MKCVCVCVSVCLCVCWFMWVASCFRAWYMPACMDACVQNLFPCAAVQTHTTLRSEGCRITHRSLLCKGGAAYGCLGGPPPPDLIPSLCSERWNASTERSGFVFSCSDGSKNVFGILYSLCWSSYKNVDWHATFVFNVGILSWAWPCPDVWKYHA